MCKNKCSCPYCQTELKRGCLSPQFCKPCSVKRNKFVQVCYICKSEYSSEYENCPICETKK